MKMTNPTISQALEEFDKKFVIKKGWEIGQVAFKDKPKSMIWKEVGGNPKQLRAFLQSKLEEAYQKGIKDTEHRWDKVFKELPEGFKVWKHNSFFIGGPKPKLKERTK